MFTGVFKASPSRPLPPFQVREKLTRLLASKPLQGHRFIPQGRVGPFIVDYLCREAGVIIDFVQPGSQAHPASREQFLAQMGYRVLKVAPKDVACPRNLLCRIRAAVGS